jgi:hypothetical protein
MVDCYTLCEKIYKYIPCTTDFENSNPSLEPTIRNDVQRRDGFHHQTRLSGGEVYRELRLGEASDRADCANQRSRSDRVALHQLLKRDDLTASFDALLEYPGLWVGLMLGNIQRLLALRCDEVGLLPSYVLLGL